MGFNLGTSSNTGKLHMTDFLKTDNAVQNTEKEIPINQLVPWENQPFKMYGEFKLHELAESIKENGLLSPIIVCPLDNGKYRIIAGHNRVEACKIAGITNIPSVVKNVLVGFRAIDLSAHFNTRNLFISLSPYRRIFPRPRAELCVWRSLRRPIPACQAQSSHLPKRISQ